VVTTGAGAGVGADGAGAGDAAAPGAVAPGAAAAAPGVVAPPIGAIGSAAELDGVEGVVAVDEDELDQGDEVEDAVVVLAGVVTEGVEDVLGVVAAGVDGVLGEEPSGATAQPEGSLIGSGVLVAAAGDAATESLIASRRSDIDRGAASATGVAATGDGVLSGSFSSVSAALSWLVPAVPAARLPNPPATGAASLSVSFLSSCFSAVAAWSVSPSFSRLKKAVTSPPVGMMVTTSQPAAARALSFTMRPSTS
jgi:hypothetical protein